MMNIPPIVRFVKASAFVNTFTPYRGRHVRLYDSPSLFGNTWTTSQKYLTDQIIQSGIEGEILAGYFLAQSPRAFSLDIDDHANRGPGFLAAVYREAVARLAGEPPSILRKSPRGLHAFWFMSYPVPLEILLARLNTMLSGVPIEIRPTGTTALRIPAESDLIDPVTFMPLRESFEIAVAEAVRYHPAEVLGESIVPRAVRDSLRERRADYERLRRASTIARAEAAHQYIFPKESNDALCALVPLYRAAELTEDEAAARFALLLAPVYDGELRDWSRLIKRVHSFYKNAPERNPYEEGRVDVGLFDQMAARNVAALWTGPAESRQQRAALTVRRRNLEAFALDILQWRGYVDTVRATPSEVATWDYLYPYFRKNVAEGYTPLPRNLLMKFDNHYHRLLPHLVGTGFLERSPYQYSAEGGICYYYRVNDQKFI